MNKINRNRMRDRTFETNFFLFTQDCIQSLRYQTLPIWV